MRAFERIYAYITNFNGMKFLPDTLPTMVKAAEACPCPVKLVLLDNGSRDESLEYVKKNFPDKIDIFRATKNGWTFSVNECLPVHRPDVFFVLNNDLKLEGNFFKSVLSGFDDPTVAVVGGNTYDWEGKNMTLGVVNLDFERCPIRFVRRYLPLPDPAVKPFVETVYVGAGACAFDGKIFHELNSFDQHLYPAYYEDMDFCLRARLAGYKVVLSSEAKCLHFGGGSQTNRKYKAIALFHMGRNDTVFTVKFHISKRPAETLLYLAKRLAKESVTLPSAALGRLAALPRLFRLERQDIEELEKAFPQELLS